MKEYKIIKQTGTTIKSQQDFEDLLNSYAKMRWEVINLFSHRGVISAVLVREKEDR